jgi:hypothetical protein
MRDKHYEPVSNLRRILKSVSLALGTFTMRGGADLAPDVPAGDYYPHWPDTAKSTWCIHDLVKAGIASSRATATSIRTVARSTANGNHPQPHLPAIR